MSELDFIPVNDTIEEKPTEVKTEIETTEEIPVKKGRGRPKGSTKKKKKLKENNISENSESTENIDAEINELKDGYKKVILDLPEDKKTGIETPAEKFHAIVSGYTLLVICDFVFPAVITFVMKRFFKKEINIRDLRLTIEEKEELEEIADEASKYLFKNANPVQLFALAIGSVYLGKAFDKV
jgi:hypothetical protein